MSEPTIVEQIEQFKRGEKKLSDLPQSTQDAILSGKVPDQAPAPVPTQPPEPEPETQDQDDPAEPTQPEPDQPKKPEAKKPAQQAPGAFKKPAPKTRAELQRLAKERADALNTLEQRNRQHEARLARDPAYRAQYFGKLGIEPPDQARTELEQLKREHEQLKQERELERIYADMDTFLKKQGVPVGVSIREIDQAARKLEAVEGRPIGAEDLVALGFDADDAEAYATLVAVQQHQMELKYPTFTSAYADWSMSNGKGLKTRQQPAKPQSAPQQSLDDSEARKEAIRRALSSPKSLPSQRSVSEKAGGMTKAQALDWLRNHPNPVYYSDEQKRVWEKIKPLISGR